MAGTQIRHRKGIDESGYEGEERGRLKLGMNDGVQVNPQSGKISQLDSPIYLVTACLASVSIIAHISGDSTCNLVKGSKWTLDQY